MEREYSTSPARNENLLKAQAEQQAKASACAPQPEDLSTLDRIAARIENVSQYLLGQAGALNAHADRVHGPTPVGGPGREDELRDRPCAALDRIWLALDELDRAREIASMAAERNITLA